MVLDFFEIDTIDDHELKFAVISASYQGKWVFVRHKERKSWEIPGGHREQGEFIIETAKREIFEETGAKVVELIAICDYSMDASFIKKFGRLYFAKIKEIGQLPESEIAEIKLFENLPTNLTYLEIQPQLFEKTMAFLNANENNNIKNCEVIHLK